MTLTNLTPRTPSSLWTNACEATDAVDACGAAQTRLWRAFIDINTAVWSGKSLCAHASKPTGAGFACAAVMAWLALALINRLSAEWSTPTRRANTNRCCITGQNGWRARAAIGALAARALCHTFSACLTRPARWTFARKRTITIHTDASIFARVWCAFIQI